MKEDQSFKSFNSISKSNDDQNSSLMTNTINPNIAKLSFRVKFETKYGQSLFIIGSIEELGEWDPSKAIPMATSKDIYPTWKITKEFTCPIGMEISYKYIVKEGNNIYWEEINNDKKINRRIVIQSPGNLIIFDEKSNNISKIKTVGYIPMNSGTGNLSNTTNLLQNLLSNLSFTTQPKNYNNNFLSSNLYMASYQSLSSFQKDSIDFSLMKLTEGENADNNYFKDFSSKDISYEFVEDQNPNDNHINLDQNLELLDLYQNILPDDKIIIVTTFLPFIIEKKDISNNIDNTNNLNISENNINIRYNITLHDDKIVNLILYSLKSMNICEVHWVGMLRGLEEYPEKSQYEISEFLEEQKIYVVIPQKKDLINFQIYVNKILRPLYNNLEIDIDSHFYQNPDNYYSSYLNVNKYFAETIHSCSNDNSRMIFINDIDLAFVPNYLLNKNLGANICLYLHSNFPDYDTLSLMHNNKDIIKSLLLCNTLGFHSFSHAQNFFDAIKRYFNSNYKVRFDGLFFIEYMKREIPIFIRNANVEIDSVKNIYKNILTKENNTNNNIIKNDKTINLLSFDTIINIYDILKKLNIFMELNEIKYLDYKYRLEIIIIKDTYTNKYLNEENEKNLGIINDKVNIIKDKLGKDYNDLFKISFVDFIIVKEQINYFMNTDIFLFTDNNLWNGTRTLLQEFIIVQNELITSNLQKNNNNENTCTNNKIVGLIVGQNIVVPEELKTIIKANFSDINTIKNVLQRIIKINQEEKIKIINNDCSQIKKNSTTKWIRDCLCVLKKVMVNNKNKIRQKIHYGIEFSYYQISKNCKQLSQKYIPISFQSKSTKLFLFDLNSIFTCTNNSSTENKDDVGDDINNNLNIDNNNNNVNNLSNSYIDNNKKIIDLLSNLSFDENNIIYLITNKSKDVFKEINLNPIKFGYVAEGGYIIKPPGEQNFKNTLSSTNDNNWKNSLIQLFTNFSKKLGIGNISQKEYSVCWNYKNNESDNGSMLIEELKFLVENSFDKGKFDIIVDNNNLEVKIKNNNKYHYILEIVQNIINEQKNFNFIFGLNNNDQYGEGFFEYLYGVERHFKENNVNINLFNSVIGKKTTKANYYFKDLNGFIEVFKVFDMKNK